jgi:hypothetical protein
LTNLLEHFSKPSLLDQIRTERRKLEETLACLTQAQMLLPGVDGEWSVKDALAHISTWEHWMIRWIGRLLQGEKPDTPEPWDVERMNAGIYALVKKIPLAKVLEEFRQSYWASLALAKRLSEEQLQSIYADSWPMGPLWTGVAANTNWHYKEHRTDIQKWIELRKIVP